MELKDVFTRIEKLTAQATLHGWYDGIDEQVTALVDSIDPQLADQIIERMKKQLDKGKDLSKDEYILTVVFLHKLHYSSIDLTDKLYLNLLEKIYDNDYHFLINHLFQNEHPFPAEMTNNMIRRIYLSYKRAINEAFKINSVELKIPPADAVLYFSLLLCHRSLNDQNKAMIYFLISRIDTELPEELYKETMRYIFKLSAVIKEVEEEAEAALSKSLNMNEEVNRLLEEETEAPSAEELPEESGVPPETDSAATGKAPPVMSAPKDKSDAREDRLIEMETGVSSVDGTTPVQSPGFDPTLAEGAAEDEKTLIEPLSTQDRYQTDNPITGGTGADSPSAPTLSLDGLNTPSSASGNNPLPDAARVSNEQTATGIGMPESGENGKGNDLTEISMTENADDSTAEDESTYNVTFSKSLDEILRLAEQFNSDNTIPEYEGEKSVQAVKKERFKADIDPASPSEGDEETTAGEEGAISADTTDKESHIPLKMGAPFSGLSGAVKRILPGIRKRKKLFILPLVITAGLVLYFALFHGRTGTEDKPGPAVAAEAPESNAGTADSDIPGGAVSDETVTDETASGDNNIDARPLEGAEPAAETEPAAAQESGIGEARTLEYRASDGERFSFILEKGRVIWKVNDQNSFWNLYVLLSADDIVDHPILKSIGDQSWHSYFNRMAELNPRKRVLRNILEEDRYTIYEE